jgi:putative acetyltransferase
MEIIQATSTEQIEQIKTLFREYFLWLEEVHDLDISYQGIENEIATLPGLYAPPQGRLLLICEQGETAGCGALRPIDTNTCEIKRMYVRSAYRGKGLGRAIALRLIDEAQQTGYQRVLLDTGAFMYAAQALYRSLGFHETDAYYEVPDEIKPRTVFMELDLKTIPKE